MLVTTHALVGGFLASKIDSPYLSYPLILIGHILMDRIPHWDEGVAFNKKQKKQLLISGLSDSLVAIVLIWLIFQKNLPLKPWSWGGVFLSVLPDLIEFPVMIFNWRPWPLNKIEWFHSHLMHRKADFLRGLIPQLIIVVLILIFW